MVVAALLAGCTAQVGPGDGQQPSATAPTAALRPTKIVAPGLTPPPNPTIQVCGARLPSDLHLAASEAGASPISGKLFDVPPETQEFRLLATTPARWYVKTGHEFLVFDAATGHRVASFRLSRTLQQLSSSFAVDPDGAVYVAEAATRIYKFDDQGREMWVRSLSDAEQARTVYGYGVDKEFRIGFAGEGGSYVWDSSGNRMADNKVPEAMAIDYAPHTGHITWGNGSQVAVYDGSGSQRLFYMGTDLAPNDPGPMHLYLGGGIAETGDGRYAVYDGQIGIRFFDSTGTYLGLIPTDPIANRNGGIDFMRPYESRSLVFYNGRFHLLLSSDTHGQPYLGSLEKSMATEMLANPQEVPFGLGLGAGLSTAAPDNYFPAGVDPTIRLEFYPWWSGQAHAYTGTYTVRSIQQVKANEPGTPVKFDLPSMVHDGRMTLSVAPATAPGFYEVDVRIQKDGVTVGADCLRYAVGAAGVEYTPANTPGGEARGVALAAMFGQRLYRGKFSMEQYLPRNARSAARMEIPSEVDDQVRGAVRMAAERGVVYEMQLATGGEREKAVVAAGRWEARVEEWGRHFRKVGVTHYEAWNEPNSTYSGSGGRFTRDILKPFFKGLKLADPRAVAIGGGILNADLQFWQEIADSGGLKYMDVAGVHPYTGHNRSFEEHGMLDQLVRIQKILKSKGRDDLKIYDTESGFWATGPNQYYTQGDKLVRKMILERSIGIEMMSNFYNDGNYSVDAQDWSLRQGDQITPAGLAAVVYRRYVGDRPFHGWIETGVPHAFAAVFGASPGSSGSLVVLWADDYSIPVRGTLSGGGSAMVADQWGAKFTLNPRSDLTISGSVTYIEVPEGQNLSIAPAESYGANLARSANGSVATASSHPDDYGSPSLAIDGIGDTEGRGGNMDGISAWMQRADDPNPWLAVTMREPHVINRVFVASQGLGSVQTGLRSYDVQVDDGGGAWRTVAEIRDEYFSRSRMVEFDATTAIRVRLTNLSVNYSGYGDGLPPPTWPPGYLTAGDVWTGQTVVYELEIYGPGRRP